MIAELINKNNSYYCSECRMKQELQPYCYFCGANFSNYEKMLFLKFLEEKDSNIKESYYGSNE